MKQFSTTVQVPETTVKPLGSVGEGLGARLGSGVGCAVGLAVGSWLGGVVGLLLDLSTSAQQRARNRVSEATQVEYQAFLVVASAEKWPLRGAKS